MMAVSIELKEEKLVTFEHAIPNCEGYFALCDSGKSSFTDEEVERILKRMKEIIKAYSQFLLFLVTILLLKLK